MAHFSFTSLFQIGFLLILICWTKESTGASFSLEEEFKEFKIQMKEIVKNLESKVTELEAKDVQMRDKVNELELRDVEMRDKIAQQDSLLFDLLREKNERTAAAAANPVAINGLPSSCGDLKMIGHTLNGFYSIAGSAMIESVAISLNFPVIPKWIGYADVKSAPVHFYVQRNSNFGTNGIIPFGLARLNEGNAMNLQTGIFTAPRPGIYFFSFTGEGSLPASPSKVWLEVSLYLNGDQIGTGRVEESNDYAFQLSPLTLQSTLNLKKDDQVWVESFSQSGYLADSSAHLTHFTGFMLKEEIVASL